MNTNCKLERVQTISDGLLLAFSKDHTDPTSRMVVKHPASGSSPTDVRLVEDQVYYRKPNLP